MNRNRMEQIQAGIALRNHPLSIKAALQQTSGIFDSRYEKYNSILFIQRAILTIIKIHNTVHQKIIRKGTARIVRIHAKEDYARSGRLATSPLLSIFLTIVRNRSSPYRPCCKTYSIAQRDDLVLMRTPAIPSTIQSEVQSNLAAVNSVSATTSSAHKDYFHAVYFIDKTISQGNRSKTALNLMSSVAANLDVQAKQLVSRNTQESRACYVLLSTLKNVPVVYKNDAKLHLNGVHS